MLIAPMFSRGTSARDLDQLASRIAADLRLARTTSMRNNLETALAFDPRSRTFQVLPGRDHVALPADVSASLTTAREVQEGALATIRFLPDGRSSGGEIRLDAGEASARLSVDWLTGWVRKVPAPR